MCMTIKPMKYEVLKVGLLITNTEADTRVNFRHLLKYKIVTNDLQICQMRVKTHDGKLLLTP